MTNARVQGQGDIVKNYRYAKMAKMKLCFPVSLLIMFDFLSNYSPCKTFSRKFKLLIR